MNGEHGYEPRAVAREVSQAIASHIGKRGLMRVRADADVPADYVLRGDLRRLYGVQDFHWGSAVGAQFGLIGALATANNRSPVQIWIEFDRLTLSDARGRVVARLPPVQAIFQGELPIDAECVATYQHVKDQFKIAVGRLAARVEEAVRHSEAVAAARGPEWQVKVPWTAEKWRT